MNSEWIQWLVSMGVGAGITWGVLTSRLSALETDVASFKQSVKSELEQIREDVREIRNYLMPPHHGPR